MKCQMLLLAALIAFSACEKEEDESLICTIEEDPELLNYFPLKVGNYWEFDEYHVDSTGLDTLTRTGIRMEIMGTEEINGHTYYKFNNNAVYLFFENPMLARDSSGYLVSPSGRILMSNQNFGVSHAFESSDDFGFARVTSSTMLEHIHEKPVFGSYRTVEMHEFYLTFDTIEAGTGVHFAPNVGPFMRKYAYHIPWVESGKMVELRLQKYLLE